MQMSEHTSDMDSPKDDLIDYAMPLIQVEVLAKQIHNLCLERKFGDAQLLARTLCVEGRLLQHVLRIMEEKETQLHATT
jgi:hypothetical protein